MMQGTVLLPNVSRMRNCFASLSVFLLFVPEGAAAAAAAAKKAPALCGQDLVSALSRFHLPAHPEKLRLTVK